MHVRSTIREDWQTEENEERWDDGHHGVLMECAYLIHRLLLHGLLFKCFFSFADSGKIWCRIRAEKRDSKIVRHLVKGPRIVSHHPGYLSFRQRKTRGELPS